MKPSTRMRRGIRKAFNRRYGYAALRTLRIAMVRAVEDDLGRCVGDRPYVSEADRLRVLYWSALTRLRKRWPNVDLEDVRAEP